MTTDSKDISGLIDAAYALIKLRGTLELWLHGSPWQDVMLGGAAVPSLRKLVATIDERESHAAQEAIADGISEVVSLKSRVVELSQGVAAMVAELKCINPAITLLGENAAPTAAYDSETGTLSLGIPAGKTGAQGPPGPPGQAPNIDTLDCGGAYSEPLTIIDGGFAVLEV